MKWMTNSCSLFIFTAICLSLFVHSSFATTIDRRTEPAPTTASTIDYDDKPDGFPVLQLPMCLSPVLLIEELDPYTCYTDWTLFAWEMNAVAGTPHFIKIAEGVYESQGFGFGDVSIVATNDGLVVIDTGDSMDSAAAILKCFRGEDENGNPVDCGVGGEIDPVHRTLPIKYIIYTHSHTDHIRGGIVFEYDDTGDAGGKQIIAADNFESTLDFQRGLLGPYQIGAREMQSGRYLPSNAFPMPMGAAEQEEGQFDDSNIPMPTITVKDDYEFTLGGKSFQVMHTPGETDDHLSIWMPNEQILFCGDLWYWSFPNLHSPMLNSRPIQEWIQSLERLLNLGSEILVTQHGTPVAGNEKVKEVLTNYINAIEYVHDETVAYINAGKSELEAANEIRLPEDLGNAMMEGKPYLQQIYGTVEWSVRGIYRRYVGFYDGRGAEAFRLPPSYTAREIVRLVEGGANAILNRAKQLQKINEHQRCIELCDIVINANPEEELTAREIKAYSLWVLAYHRLNINNFGIYRSAYAREMAEIERIKNQ